MTPTQHLLNTVVLLTLSTTFACDDKQSLAPQKTEAETKTASLAPDKSDVTTAIKNNTETQTETQTTIASRINSKTDTEVQTEILKDGDIKIGTAQALSKSLIKTGQYCVNILEGAPCPSIESLNKDMPKLQGCEPRKYTKIIGKAKREDLKIIRGRVPRPKPEDGDACCYKANYVKTKRRCSYGRPLMQGGEAQLAQTSNNQAWGENTRIVGNHSATERVQAGNFYLQNALFEHASIASFHKFALELMRFGAPPKLLMKVQEAIQDEIEHAQIAFGIASELLEKSIGPDLMSIQPQLATSLKDLAIATFKEGAVGESIAVILAATQRVQATEPVICAFLDRIIADESKHAELAWETLRWCIEQDSSIAQTLLDIDDAELLAPFLESEEAPIPALGILSKKQHKQAVLRGLQEVVIPSLQVLTASHMYEELHV